MADLPLILIENKIPFIKNRLEQVARVKYLAPDEFTPQAVANADAMIIRTRTHCDKQLLQNSSVKFIATATIGTDHIDLNWCNDNGITVKNAPGCNAPAVAQYVWASILKLGIKPKKSTIGIVGYGNVGKIVADYANQLGAKVLLCDPPLQEQNVSTPYPLLPLEEMIPLCDIISLHTPLTKSGKHPTHHLINESRLDLFKNGSTLINAARGPIVQTIPLYRAINQKYLNAIIDCWEHEPIINLSLLRETKIATPHIAGYSLEGKQRATRMAIEATLQHFSLPSIDLSDLAGPYTSKKITAKQILDSYDPIKDTKQLFSIVPVDLTFNTNVLRQPLLDYPRSPQLFSKNFERLRSEYNYRPEP